MWWLLQTWTEHFWSWYTEWQFGQLLFQMFSSICIHTDRSHDLTLQSSKPARQKNISQACNLFPVHFIQPTRCFHWRFSLSRMCTQSCCCLCWFSIKIKGTNFISKYAQVQKNVWMGKRQDFLYVQFLDGFFHIFFQFSKICVPWVQKTGN